MPNLLNNQDTLNTDHVVTETAGADKILLVMIHECLEWYREFPDCVNSAHVLSPVSKCNGVLL